MTTNKKQAIAALNVYKKIAIVRRESDSLSYEDEKGTIQTVSNLGAAAAATTPTLQPKRKHEIPVPRIERVQSYDKDVPPTYETRPSYVRYKRQTPDEFEKELEYVADNEDEQWLVNNSKFGQAKSKGGPQITLRHLETMLDILEKQTGFETIVTLFQAEQFILGHIPELSHVFPTKPKSGIVALKHVLQDVYNYWVQKRSKLKRPLLRRFWPVTASDDTNPHLVFRPREKEKYKLRKKRQNDMDAYRKMKQLRADFEKVRILMALVKQREELNLMMVKTQIEWFQQKMFDIVDTRGIPRESQVLKRDAMTALLNVPKYIDVTAIPTKGQQKKRRRGRGEASDSRSSTPITAPGMDIDDTGSMISMATGGSTMKALATSAPAPAMIAGQNHGEPAPNFLHPLKTREAYTTSWNNAVPFITCYQDAHPVPTFRFRHRPRIGRGGRVIIDRVPQPISNGHIQPVTTFIAGRGLNSGAAKQRLLDLLPAAIDYAVTSRRIEEICANALKEDMDAPDDDEHDGEEVLVKADDWLDTDDQLWGDERYAIGSV